MQKINCAYNSQQVSYMQKIYGCFSEIFFTAAKPFLIRKYGADSEQRFGHYSPELPKNALWIHAVSVGEVQTAYPLVREIKTRDPDVPILLSTITKTGNNMASQLMGHLAHPIYYPWDAPSIINRALDTLMPRAYVTVETEIWPEILLQLSRRGIPAFLAGARLSDTSFKKYYAMRSFWRPVIRRYTLVLTRSEIDRQRFIRLGCDPQKVKVTGDCKIDALIQRKKRAHLAPLAPYFSGQDPVILAGSTHEGEDRIVFEAYAALLKKFPSLRLILAPRHPERAHTLAQQARNLGFTHVALMTAPHSAWKILIVDKIGVLFPLYGCVKAAFIGGSLVPKGGQNIMEPAIWGTPFCQGPDHRDFAEATNHLMRDPSCRIIHDAAEMARYFEEILTTPDHSHYTQTCQKYITAHSGAAVRTWNLIKNCLHQTAKN